MERQFNKTFCAEIASRRAPFFALVFSSDMNKLNTHTVCTPSLLSRWIVYEWNKDFLLKKNSILKNHWKIAMKLKKARSSQNEFTEKEYDYDNWIYTLYYSNHVLMFLFMFVSKDDFF